MTSSQGQQRKAPQKLTPDQLRRVIKESAVGEPEVVIAALAAARDAIDEGAHSMLRSEIDDIIERFAALEATRRFKASAEATY